MSAFVALIVALIGLLLYVIPGVPPKLQECGRIMFAVGLLVTLWPFQSHMAKLL